MRSNVCSRCIITHRDDRSSASRVVRRDSTSYRELSRINARLRASVELARAPRLRKLVILRSVPYNATIGCIEQRRGESRPCDNDNSLNSNSSIKHEAECALCVHSRRANFGRSDDRDSRTNVFAEPRGIPCIVRERLSRAGSRRMFRASMRERVGTRLEITRIAKCTSRSSSVLVRSPCAVDLLPLTRSGLRIDLGVSS